MAVYQEVFSDAGKVFTATSTIELGDVVQGTVARWLVTVYDESSMSVSLLFKGTARKSGLTKTTIAYQNANAPNTDATAAITAAGNYLVEASGMDVDIALTVTGGSVRILARPCQG